MFRDDFEKGDTSAWTGEETDSGDLSISTDAKIHGIYGLSVLIDDTNAIYVYDNTPLDEPRYRCRFYLDPNSITMANNDEFALVNAMMSGGAQAFYINLKYTTANGYRINVRDYTDGALSKVTSDYDITDAQHCIEVDWQASSAVGANDGQLVLIIDGVIKETLTGIDSDTESITSLRFGAPSGLDVGTSGTIYLDDFVSNNDGVEIGCIGDFPKILNIISPIMARTSKEINGPWTAELKIESDEYIKAENYIELDDENYIVKKLRKINNRGKIYFDIKLDHIMSELADLTIDRFYIKDTVSNHLDYLLTDTGWTAGTSDITSTILLNITRRTTVLEALYMLAGKVDGELYFNNDRTVDLKEEIGTVTKLQLRYDKNCDYIEKEEDSTKIITRLYPYGPDNNPINSIALQNMDDSSEWTASGTSVSGNITVNKMEGSGCVQFTDNGPGDTLTHDKGVGNELDLSGKNKISFKIFDAGGSGIDFSVNNLTFGIGEAAWNDNTIVISSGTVVADSWLKVEVDISGISDANKDAIRYIGFQGGGDDYYIDDIRTIGQAYIDSANRNLYKINKEAVYFHTTDVEISQRTINILPTDDARCYQGSGNSNFGLDVILEARDYAPYSYVSFVKFGDLSAIPPNATITSATLKAYVSKVLNGGETVDCYYADDDWSELTIKWNNKPGTDGNIGSVAMTSTGWKTLDMTTALNNWLSGTKSNFGIQMEVDITPDANKSMWFNSKENSENKIRLEIAYTLSEDPGQLIEDSAQNYLSKNDEPRLKYSARMADLSRAIVGTWRDETINLGDTARMYDDKLGINTDCRIKRIVKDLLDPKNTQVDLTNRAYDITDTQALLEKKLKYAMPFNNDNRVLYANAVQKGYLGGEVGGV